LARILDTLGRDGFERSADRAWAVAPYTGLRDSPEPSEGSLIHEVCWHVSQLAPHGKRTHRKLRLLCELYELSPDYAVLMAARWEHAHLSSASRRFLFRRYRRWLGDDAALAAPVQYSLWCDWFEDRQTATMAWRAVTARPWRRRRIERVLDCAGPVPFEVKAALYDQLLADPRWHRAIYTSLLHSACDAYGSFDPPRARALLDRLRLPADTPEPTFFRDRFGWGR
jgi:hypothetical protein